MEFDNKYKLIHTDKKVYIYIYILSKAAEALNFHDSAEEYTKIIDTHYTTRNQWVVYLDWKINKKELHHLDH